MAFKVYKSDRRKAKIGDPYGCWLALGIRRHPDVVDVYVGSGKDAYVVFKGRGGEGPYAIHFIVGTSLRSLIDAFDKDKKTATQMLILRRPAESMTLEHRRKSNKKRAADVRSGKVTVKTRGPQKDTRITRIGMSPRPRVRISESGSVSALVPIDAGTA
jgi:hypothetical protein